MTTSPQKVVWVCGRQFTENDLQVIRDIMVNHPSITRTALSREVCDALGWVRFNGQRKDMSCRVALQRLEQRGLLTLPAPTKANGNGKWRPRLSGASDPREPIVAPVQALEPILLLPIASRKQARWWNELIQRYHYLGHRPLPGAQFRYLIHCRYGVVGALSFSAAAWKIAPRDQWIGWVDAQRRNHLQLIVCNSRFLILPWVTAKNLASKILSLAARQLPGDWQRRHGFQPVLLETFVEKGRFAGTCYKAANWIYLGQTQGRGKCDRFNQNVLPIKDIYVYPLCRDFRQHLLATATEVQR